ncbi:MAG: hypothetical protein ACE5MK_02110 [Acidobacteriota bacterium]
MVKLPPEFLKHVESAARENLDEDPLDVALQVIEKFSSQSDARLLAEYLETIEVPEDEDPFHIFVEQAAEEVERLRETSKEG